MQPIPEGILKQFSEVLAQRAVPSSLHDYFPGPVQRPARDALDTPHLKTCLFR